MIWRQLGSPGTILCVRWDVVGCGGVGWCGTGWGLGAADDLGFRAMIWGFGDAKEYLGGPGLNTSHVWLNKFQTELNEN